MPGSSTGERNAYFESACRGRGGHHRPTARHADTCVGPSKTEPDTGGQVHRRSPHRSTSTLTHGKVLRRRRVRPTSSASSRRDGTIKTIAADAPGTSGCRYLEGRAPSRLHLDRDERGTFENTASGLNIWGPRGKRVHADTLAYETKNNPDKINFYGVKNPSQCVIDAFTAAQFPVAETRPRRLARLLGDAVRWQVDRRGRGCEHALEDRQLGQDPHVGRPPATTDQDHRRHGKGPRPSRLRGGRDLQLRASADRRRGRQGRLPLRDHAAGWPGEPGRWALGASCGR